MARHTIQNWMQEQNLSEAAPPPLPPMEGQDAPMPGMDDMPGMEMPLGDMPEEAPQEGEGGDEPSMEAPPLGTPGAADNVEGRLSNAVVRLLGTLEEWTQPEGFLGRKDSNLSKDEKGDIRGKGIQLLLELLKEIKNHIRGYVGDRSSQKVRSDHKDLIEFERKQLYNIAARISGLKEDYKKNLAQLKLLVSENVHENAVTAWQKVSEAESFPAPDPSTIPEPTF